MQRCIYLMLKKSFKFLLHPSQGINRYLSAGGLIYTPSSHNYPNYDVLFLSVANITCCLVLIIQFFNMSILGSMSRLPTARRLPFAPNIRRLMTNSCSASTASNTSTPLTSPAISLDIGATVSSATAVTVSSSLASSTDPIPTNSTDATANQEHDLDREKRYIRLAGPASYCTRDDVMNFLQQHTLNVFPKMAIAQGQSDIFQNHSIWMIETPSEKMATQVASCISGRVLGLKLVRAAPVDQKLYDNFIAAPNNNARLSSLRKRLTIIAPKPEERGRALLVRQLRSHITSRAIWAFFGAYDVVDVRYLRKSGVACIIFQTEEEASRALRERKNMPIQHQFKVSLKMHE